MLTENDQVEACYGLQSLLNHSYGMSLAHLPVIGMTLPSGEVLHKDFGLALVNQAIVKRAQALNLEPEAALFLLSDEVVSQVALNGYCLCVGIKRGEGSMEYVALHETRLLLSE